MSRFAPFVRFLSPLAALILLGVPVLGYLLADDGRASRLGFDLHAPKLDLLAAAPTAIQIHVAAALTALAIGTVLLIGIKGTRVHRTLGWVWVLAMGTTAISSFFIHQINPGGRPVADPSAQRLDRRGPADGGLCRAAAQGSDAPAGDDGHVCGRPDRGGPADLPARPADVGGLLRLAGRNPGDGAEAGGGEADHIVAGRL